MDFSSNNESIKNFLEDYFPLYNYCMGIITKINILSNGYILSVLVKLSRKYPFLPDNLNFDHILLPGLRHLGRAIE